MGINQPAPPPDYFDMDLAAQKAAVMLDQEVPQQETESTAEQLGKEAYTKAHDLLERAKAIDERTLARHGLLLLDHTNIDDSKKSRMILEATLGPPKDRGQIPLVPDRVSIYEWFDPYYKKGPGDQVTSVFGITSPTQLVENPSYPRIKAQRSLTHNVYPDGTTGTIEYSDRPHGAGENSASVPIEPNPQDALQSLAQVESRIVAAEAALAQSAS